MCIYIVTDFACHVIFEVHLLLLPPPPLQVLDHNIEFGQTRGLLSLILKLLAYSAAPDMERYTKFEQEERHASSGGPEYGLGALPSHLQAPWLRVFFVILYKVSTRACIYYIYVCVSCVSVMCMHACPCMCACYGVSTSLGGGEAMWWSGFWFLWNFDLTS